MAKSLNRVDLLGYLGSDVNISHLPEGTAVGKVSLATDQSYKDASGEWAERTEWHAVAIWRADSAARVLVKGARVHLTGRLRTRSWDDPDGTKRIRTEVVCDARDVIVVSMPKDGRPPVTPEAPSEGGDVGYPA